MAKLKEIRSRIAKLILIRAWTKERAERRKSPISKRNVDIKNIASFRDHARRTLPIFERKGLSTRQIQVLLNLKEAAETMMAAGWSGERNSDGAHEIFMVDYSNYERAIEKAINAGLTDYPLVRDWISSQRTFGEWDKLRRFKRQRLEKGVSKPLSKEGLWIRFEAQPLLDEGKGPQEILRSLRGKLRRNEIADCFELSGPKRNKLRKGLKSITRQGFQQKLKRLEDWPRRKKTST